MKYKRKKATFGVLAPNIQRGGMAIPLGNNLYWMKGRKHKTGGIDIGKDLEVENNEVMQMLPNETRVFSSVKMLGGNSPAELVASGMNPNMVFNAQEEYKRINRIKDDGSRYKRGGRKRADDGTSVETNNFARILYNNRYRNNKSTSLNMNNEEKVLSLANYVRPKNNYEYAVDGEDSALFPFRKLANTVGLPSGLSNCTLTISQLYNPDRPISHARTITKNPRGNGFYEVTPDYAIPGSMVIASNNLNDNDENNVYHTMVLTGFADKDYTYDFNGTPYKIKKGTPLVSYSRGGNNVGDWRSNIPLNVYMDNSNGKNFVRYYRPLDKNGNPNVLLDELTVQPKKYGGRKKKEDGGEEKNDFVLNYLSQLQNNPIYRMNQIMTGNNMDLERQIENVRNTEEINRPTYNSKDNRYYGSDDPIRPAELNKNIYPKDLSDLSGVQGITSSKIGEDRTLTGQNYIQYRSPLYYNDPQYNINEYGIDNEAIEAKQLIDHERTHAAANSPIEINTTPQEDMINFILGDEYYNTNPTYTKRPKEILAAMMALRGANNMTPQSRFISIDGLYDDIQSNNVKGEHYIIPEGSRQFLKQFTKEQLYRLFNEVAHNTNTNNMNLQNIDNPLARYGKRMISPNKLGTIVRVDGNGRDRLAYIPSTGSSKQDMKCGGRAKASFGSSLSRLNSMLSQIDMDALSDAWNKVEEMEDEKYNNVKSNMIQLDDGTFIKESLPEVDVTPKRNLFKLPILNITSAPNTELRRPDFNIGNPIIPDDIKDKIKGLGDYNDYHWIKSGTDLLTTGLSTFNNLYYLNRMKEPPRPAVNPGVKLKTKWNNNATLSAIRESLGNTITDLARNTASSQNLKNSINQARANALGLINKSNEDKENKETELINADLKQRATTIKDNVDNYNTWRNSLAAFRNNIFDKRSETWNNMMSNVNKVVNEAIENREQRDAERRQFDFLSYGYPIVRNNPAIANYLYDILFGKNNINVKSR